VEEEDELEAEFEVVVVLSVLGGRMRETTDNMSEDQRPVVLSRVIESMVRKKTSWEPSFCWLLGLRSSKER